jgi:hypothetical protein
LQVPSSNNLEKNSHSARSLLHTVPLPRYHVTSPVVIIRFCATRLQTHALPLSRATAHWNYLGLPAECRSRPSVCSFTRA